MLNLKYIYKKFFNLGVFSRVLLVIVKPLALWLSIQLDTDAGVAVAQIYIIGLLFVSLSGTDAHKSFYKIYFGNEKPKYGKDIARSYANYIQKITFQLILITIISSLIISVIFWGSFDIVIMGIIFGIAEKLNDEFQRYSQFSNNSQSLFYLALSKLIPILVAAPLSYAVIVDIRFTFPILVLVGAIFINWQTLFSAIYYIIKIARKSFFEMIIRSFNYIHQDVLQIGCVFMGISLISIDKWLMQYFSITNLPLYMLFTQIASIFVVFQTITLIAPVRSRLVNENPDQIKSIKIGSPIISLFSILVGIVIYFFNQKINSIENLGYFAFFFAGIIMFTVAYSERLYWITKAKARLTLDLVIFSLLIFLILVSSIFIHSENLLVLSLGILFFLLCLRVLSMIHLIRKNSFNKS
jgi:hypothetical protein